jgi:hypothetical protein
MLKILPWLCFFCFPLARIIGIGLAALFFVPSLWSQNLPVVWLDSNWQGPWRGTEAEPCSSLTQLFRNGLGQTPIIANYAQTGVIVMVKPGAYSAATNFNLVNDFFQAGFNAANQTFIFRAAQTFMQNPNTSGRTANSASEARITDLGAGLTNTGFNNTFIFEGFTFEGTTLVFPAATRHNLKFRNNIFTGGFNAALQLNGAAELEFLQNRIIDAKFANPALLEVLELYRVNIEANEFLGGESALPNLLSIENCREVALKKNIFLNFNPAANNSVIEVKGGNNSLSAQIAENRFTNNIAAFFNAFGCIYTLSIPRVVIERNSITNITVANLPGLPTLTQRPFIWATDAAPTANLDQALIYDNLVAASACNGGIIRVSNIFFSEVKNNLIASTNNFTTSSALVQILTGRRAILQNNVFQNVLGGGNLNAACIRIGLQFPAAQPEAVDSTLISGNTLTQIGSATETGNASGIIVWGGTYHLIEKNNIASAYGVSGITILARGVNSAVAVHIRNNLLSRVRGNRILLLGQVSGVLEENIINDYDPSAPIAATGENGISFIGGNNLKIQKNSITRLPHSLISAADAVNFPLNNIYIQENELSLGNQENRAADGGISLDFNNLATNNFFIRYNNIINNKNAGLYFAFGAFNPIIRNIHFNYNVFEGNDRGIRIDGGSIGWQIDATGNWWGGSDALGPYEVKQNTNPWNSSLGQAIQTEKNNIPYNIVAYSPWLGGATTPDDDPANLGVQLQRPKNWYVAELYAGDIPGASTQGTPATVAANNLVPRNAQNIAIGAITKAIQLAKSGDSIWAHPGVYRENIKIPAGMQITLNAVHFFNVSPLAPERSVNVDLNALGYYNIPEAQLEQGFMGSTIEIEEGAALTVNGIAINARAHSAVSARGTSATLRLLNCHLVNRGAATVLVRCDFSAHSGQIDIQNCFFRSASFSASLIMLSLKGVTKGLIYQNFFDGRRYVYLNNNPILPANPLSSAAATGILLENARNLIVKQNYITRQAQAGISLNAQQGDLANLSITYNEIENNNTGNAPNQGGLSFFGRNDQPINISYNIFRNNLQNGAVIQPGSVVSGLTLERNLFHNNFAPGANRGSGLAHFGEGLIEASFNWWGAAFGPQIESNPVGEEGTPRLYPEQEILPLGQTAPRQQITGAGAHQVIYSPWVAGREDDQNPESRNAPYNTFAFNGTRSPDNLFFQLSSPDTYGYQAASEKIATVCDFLRIELPELKACAGSEIQLQATVAKGFPSPAYRYQWSGQGIEGPATSNPVSLLPPSPGRYVYALTVTDGNNCQKTAQTQVEVDQNLSVTVYANQTALQNINLCKGSSIALKVLPQGSNFTYAWSGTAAAYLSAPNSAAPTLSLPSNATPGWLQIQVSDGVCSGVAALQVTPQENTLSAFIQAPNQACEGSAVALSVLPSGGTPPYTYLWETSSNLNLALPLSGERLALEALPPGNFLFSVRVTDSNLCQKQAAHFLNGVKGISVDAGQDITLCEAAMQYALTPSVNGTVAGVFWSAVPEAGVQFLNNRFALNPTLSGLPAGVYTFRVTVNDANGCSGSDELRVTVSPKPAISFGQPLSVCAGQSLLIAPSLSGGTPPMVYQWEAEPSQAIAFLSQTQTLNPTFSSPLAGNFTYTLKATDGNGCQISASVTLKNYPLPEVTVSGGGVMCTQSSRALEASLKNGDKANYAWRAVPEAGLSFLTSLNVPKPQILNPLPGNYTYQVTATDANGCQSSASLNIAVITSSLAVNAGEDMQLCLGESKTLSAQVTGGLAQSYRWEPITGLSDPSSPMPVISGLPLGSYIYTVLVTDLNGCARQDEVTVRVRNRPSATWGSPPSSICAQSLVSIPLTFTGEPGFSVRYLEGAEEKSFISTTRNYTFTARPARSTVYTLIEISDAICSATGLSVPIAVSVIPLPKAQISGEAKMCRPGQAATLSFNFMGTPPFSARYRSSANEQAVLFNITENQYSFTVTPEIPGNYKYTLLEVSDSTGCVSAEVSGEANVSISPPTSVEFSGVATTQLLCQGEQALLLLELNGQPPFSITYTENDLPKTIGSIARSPFALIIAPARAGITAYRIIEGKDANNCPLGSSSTTRNINVLPATAARLYSDLPEEICQGQSKNLTVVFSGIPPFWASYRENGGQEIPLNNGEPIYTSPYTFSVSPSSAGSFSYELSAVSNLYCGGGQVSGRATIRVSGQAPRAVFQTPERQITLGQTATLNVTLTGVSPWRLQYQEAGGAPVTLARIAGVSPLNYSFNVTPTTIGEKIYTLLSVADSSPCAAGVVEGFAVVRVTPRPCPEPNFPITVNESCGVSRLAAPFSANEFTFEWFYNNTAIGVEAHFNATQSGVYRLRVSSPSCSSVVSSINVEIKRPPLVSLSVSPVSAGASDGGITVNVSPAGNYIFELYSGASIAGQALQANNDGFFRNLAAGTYTVVVRGFNSTACSTSTIAEIPALPDFRLKVSNISFTSANAGWNPAPGATEYEIRYRVRGAALWQALRSTVTSVVLQDLQNNTRYELQLRVILPAPSPWVKEYFQTLAFSGSCRIPGGVYVNPTPNMQTVSVFWDTVPGAKYYDIEYYSDSRLIARFSNLITAPQTFTLSSGALQQIRIRAYCESAPGQLTPSRLSSPVTFSAQNRVRDNFADSLSLENFNLQVYPNPNKGLFYLQGVANNNPGLALLKITDALGRLVFYQDFYLVAEEFNIPLDLSEEAQGVYFIELHMAKNIYRRRVVIR